MKPFNLVSDFRTSLYSYAAYIRVFTISNSPVPICFSFKKRCIGAMEAPTNEEMKIYFRLMKTIPIEAKKSDTVKKVRTDFSEMEGISLVNLKSLSFAGNWLENEKKLEDYNIMNGSIVNVFLESGFRVKVYVKMSEIGKTLTLDVDARDTVLAIKGRIQHKEGYAVSQIELYYLGEELHDSKTVAHYKIEEGSTMYALFHLENLKHIYVSLENGRRSVSLKVKNWFTVKNVKSIVESMVGIQVEKQRLYFGGGKLEDNKTLAELKILEGQSLICVRCMCLFVRTLKQETLKLEVDRDYLIENVKEMIQEVEGTHILYQRLLFAGRQLEHGRSLADYHIQDESMVHLVLRLCGC